MERDPDGARDPGRRRAPTVTLRWRIDEPPPGTEVVARVGPGLTSYARALFPDYLVAGPGGPEPGPSDTTIDLAGSKAEGFLVTVQDEVWEGRDAPGALTLFELALARSLLERLEDVRILHGAGAELGSGAVILSGHGGTGKSTLAATLARAGVPVHGDDVLLVEENTGQVRPFRRLLKVPEDSRARLGLPRPPSPLDELWPEAAFFRPEEIGSRWARPSRVDAVLFPVRRAGSAPRIEPLQATEAVRRLVGQALLVPRPTGRDFGAAVRIVEGATVGELVYEEATEAVGLLLERFPPDR